MRQNRPLSDHERAIIERLLSLDFQHADYFRRQVPAIWLAVDPAAPRAPGKRWKGAWLLEHVSGGRGRDLGVVDAKTIEPEVRFEP